MGKVSQSNINETSEFWRKHFQKKYQQVFSRNGRAKVIKFSLFSSRRLFPFKNRRGGYLFIIRKNLETKFGNKFKRVTLLNSTNVQVNISLRLCLQRKKNGSVKVAMDAKPMNDQTHRTNMRCQIYWSYWIQLPR